MKLNEPSNSWDQRKLTTAQSGINMYAGWSSAIYDSWGFSINLYMK